MSTQFECSPSCAQWVHTCSSNAHLIVRNEQQFKCSPSCGQSVRSSNARARPPGRTAAANPRAAERTTRPRGATARSPSSGCWPSTRRSTSRPERQLQTVAAACVALKVHERVRALPPNRQQPNQRTKHLAKHTYLENFVTTKYHHICYTNAHTNLNFNEVRLS